MPNDIKAMLSVVVLLVAAGFAYWEHANGNGHLPMVVIVFGIFAVIAMWVFPEAISRSEVRSKTE
jgi:hypothetical protein